jgi:hypothetical protein
MQTEQGVIQLGNIEKMQVDFAELAVCTQNNA